MAIITSTMIPALLIACERCGHRFISLTDDVSTSCPGCGSADWNKPPQRTRSHRDEIAFPAPRSPGRPKVMAGSSAIDLDEEE
jgi:predicted  nucleic acid-binding Zn-ribbon protein